MADITLLDGSIGQELVHRHKAPPTPLWSSSVMLEDPGLVGALHAEYFAAGASVATTNSYALLPDRLRGTPLEDRLGALLGAAADQARAARDGHGAGRVAGSLGPLGASYRTDLDPPAEEACARYEPVIGGLDPMVDLLIAETVASVAQARNVTAALGRFASKPAWLAFTVDDEDGTRLRSGEPLSALEDVVKAAGIEAVLINCSRPEVVDAGLELLARFGLPFGAYANGFTAIAPAFLEDRPTVDVLAARTDLGPAAYAEFAMGWVGRGATIVGGCCEVGPDHIAELARRLRAAGHRIV